MRLPAEWEPHERTIMGWPCRAELWGATLGQAKLEYAAVANAVAAHEPVTMIASCAADAAEVRAACSAAVQIVELPLDDSWLRDSGPIYVLDDGRQLALHFRFNSWGERFLPYDADAAVGRLIAQELGDPVREVDLVLEGGSILTDGAGTLFTTEQCLLHPSRNPQLQRDAIEAQLKSSLGIDQVVWLGQGLVEDRDTDGHIDLIAAPTPDGGILLQQAPPENPNHANQSGNLRRLRELALNVHEMPHLPYAEVAGETVAVSYMNFYVCNGAVVVPVCGTDSDPDALRIIGRVFPDRQIVPVPGAVLAYGGGGPHCITQQVPAER